MSVMNDGIPEQRYGQALGRDDLSNQLDSFGAAHRLDEAEEAIQQGDVAVAALVERQQELENQPDYHKRLKARTSRMALIVAGVQNPSEFYGSAPQVTSDHAYLYTGPQTLSARVDTRGYIGKAPELPTQSSDR